MRDYKTIALVLMLIIIGFKGTTADDINECESSPCTNGEECTDGVNMYTCACPSGLSAPNCTTDINECDSSPCTNGEECTDGVNMYTCACPSGFTAPNCATDINECESSPCTNGEECTDGVNMYTCACPSGSDCTPDIDECASNPCLNGGTCNNLLDSFSCDCDSGYNGITCDSELNSLSAAIKVSGVEYTAALGDTSTAEFMEAAELWEERITGGYCNATADSRNDTACQIMVTVTGFSNGSLVVNFTAVFDTSVVSTLNASNIEILNENRIAYGTTVSGITLTCGGVTCVDCTSCSEATTPATRMQGTLQCYSCTTNSITDVCSTADELASGSGVLTPTCYEGQRCWTDHYENSSHTVVSRGCTDNPCIATLHGDGPYCISANGVTSCTSCCTESKCNDNKSSSEGLTSSCVTWLTSLFSVVIMLITYRD